MTIWFAGVISIGAVMFVETVRGLLRGGRSFDNQPWIGLVVPLALFLFGIGLLWFCGRLSRGGEQFILDHLKATLSTRAEQPNPTRNQG